MSGRSSSDQRWHTTTGYVSSPCPPNILARQAACCIRIAPSRETGTWAPPSRAPPPRRAARSTRHRLHHPPIPPYLAASSLERLLPPPFHPSSHPSILHLGVLVPRSLLAIVRPLCSPSRSLSLSRLSFRARLTVTAQDDEQCWGGGRLLPGQRREGRGGTNGEKWRNGRTNNPIRLPP